MKAIGIKMVDLQPMTAREANDKGHKRYLIYRKARTR